MRLYYVDDLICNDEDLTISLAFPFEAELVLKFPGKSPGLTAEKLVCGSSRQCMAWAAWLLLCLATCTAEACTLRRQYWGTRPLATGADQTHTIHVPRPPSPATTDAETYQAWRRGFAHLLLCLMAPDAPGPTEAPGPTPSRSQNGSKAAAGWGVVGRTTSRGLMRSLSGGLEGPESLAGRRNTSAAFQALQKLGVQVQELGRRVAPRQRFSQSSSLGERPSRRAAGEGDWAGLPSSEGSQREQPDTPRAAAEQRGERAEQVAQRDAAQQAKRQRMVAYLQSVAQQHPTSVPPVVLRKEAVTPSPPSAAPQPVQPPRRRRRLSEDAGGHVRLMVSVAVQTDESALQQLAYQSARAAAPSTPPHAASASAAPLSVPHGGSEGGDAELAAQYAAVMAAAGGGSGGAAAVAAGPQQAQKAEAESGSDADIASQWMAAMMGAGGAGGAAVAAAPFGSPHPKQPGGAGPTSSGGDEDVAVQYLAAMQAAMGPAGAAPPAAQQQQQQQAEQAGEPRVRPQGQLHNSPPTPGSEQPTSAHSQRSFAHYSLPASASPLEQLAWQQQQRSLQQLQQGSPASGTSAVWHGGGTPGWNTPQRSQSLALGAGARESLEVGRRASAAVPGFAGKIMWQVATCQPHVAACALA